MFAGFINYIKKSMSYVVLLAGALVIGQYAIGDAHVKSDICDRFEQNQDYFVICQKYQPGMVKELSSQLGGMDLSSQVDDADEGSLLIIPAGEYHLIKPLQTKNGQGLLPGSYDGFIVLKPSSNYTISKDIFTVFNIGENSRQGGLDIDVDFFKDTEALKNAREKVLVHSSDIKMFEATSLRLKGSDKLDKVFWAEHKDTMVYPHEDINQILSKSYIEGMGAKITVKLEMPLVDNISNIPIAKIHNSIITVGSIADQQHENQTALHIVNGVVEVDNGHLVFKINPENMSNTRRLLHLDGSGSMTAQRMVFYSEEEMLREMDFLLSFSEQQVGNMKVNILLNNITNKTSSIIINNNNSRIHLMVKDNYIINEKYTSLPTADEFFNNSSMYSGNQFIDMFVLQKMKEAYYLKMSSNISEFYLENSYFYYFYYNSIITSHFDAGFIAVISEVSILVFYGVYLLCSFSFNVAPRPHFLFNHETLSP